MECIVNYLRGGQVESQHIIHCAVVEADGALVTGFGEPQKVTSWRSAAKPFQVLPFIAQGGQERFGISEAEVAIMAASHSGEQIHIDLVQSVLTKMDLDVNKLCCGVAEPLHLKTARKLFKENIPATVLHNNCSGKHACMLGVAKLMEISPEKYYEFNHPVQQKMLEIISVATKVNSQEIITGIDGCGVPVFFIPLYNMAWAYARLAKPENGEWGWHAKHVAVIRSAMAKYPYNIGGEGSFDTSLMECTKGRIIAKVGAEAVFCLGSTKEGLGVAYKVNDGSYRAVAPAGMAILKYLGLLTRQEHSELLSVFNHTLTNVRGDVIGNIAVEIK